jgi:hypothetical protein
MKASLFMKKVAEFADKEPKPSTDTIKEPTSGFEGKMNHADGKDGDMFKGLSYKLGDDPFEAGVKEACAHLGVDIAELGKFEDMLKKASGEGLLNQLMARARRG